MHFTVTASNGCVISCYDNIEIKHSFNVSSSEIKFSGRIAKEEDPLSVLGSKNSADADPQNGRKRGMVVALVTC